MEADDRIRRVSLIESALIVSPTVRVDRKRHAETIDSNQRYTDSEELGGERDDVASPETVMVAVKVARAEVSVSARGGVRRAESSFT